MKLLAKKILGILIFVGFVYFVEVYVGWRPLLTPWVQLPLGAMLLALLLTFVSYALRALRLFDYFRTDMAGGFAACFRLMLMHNMLNNLLPARAGELSFPVLMSRYFNLPLARSLPALLWFRVLDLHTLVALAVLTAGSHWLGVWPALVVTLAWLTVPWWLWRTSFWLQGRLAGRERRGIVRWLDGLLRGLPQGGGEFVRSWWWTLINWGVKLSVFAWVIRQFLPMAWEAAWLGAIAGDLTSVLPVHGVAGAGTFEAGVVAVLLPFGIGAAEALQAAVNLHLFLLGATLVGGGLAFFIPAPVRP